MAKLYTRQEADKLLPYLAPTLIELRDKFEEAAQIRVEITRAAAGNGGSKKREKWSRLLARVDELIDRLNEWEIVLRNVGTGLVDFPAVVDGRPAFLCWKLGEPRVAYYHSPDDGFQGRRLL